MSKGNLNTYGAKGANFDWQFAVVQLLGQIAAGSGGGGGCPCPSNAQESTLQQVLNALQNGQEFEQALVMDLGGAGCPGNCPTYIQVRVWDTVNHVFGPPTYYNAAGAVVVPVGPLQFVNPQYVLESMLAQLTAINADLDVALSTRASEATLALLNSNTVLGNLTLNSINAGIPAALGQTTMANSMPVTIANDQSAVPISLPTGVSRTPSLVAVPANTPLTNTLAGRKQVSIRVTAGANGQIGGVPVPNGFTVTYTAENNDTVGSISYQTGVGTTMIISYLL
jgi:hypothetical protein